MNTLDDRSQISLSPVAWVRSSRKEVADDGWDSEEVYVELDRTMKAESLFGLQDFSHAEIIFFMNRVEPSKIETGARHPRNNADWPLIGIFAQRGKNRPNQIGTTICEIVRVDDRKVYLKGLDAIDGTPILDIKPWVTEFGPRKVVKQPDWITELMKGYW